jgi:hypothetical protein
MNRTIATEIFDWFLVNVVAPFTLPLLFALCWSIFYTIDILSLMKLLLDNGVYTFFVLTILISLFQDYRVARTAFNIFLWIAIMACGFFTFIIFGSSLRFIPETNLESPIVVTLPLLFVAFFFKFQIAKEKYIIIGKENNSKEIKKKLKKFK